MGDEERGGAELTEVQALIREAETKRARLLREGHPRAHPADPACPLGGTELWLTALRRRRAELLRGHRPPPSPTTY